MKLIVSLNIFIHSSATTFLSLYCFNLSGIFTKITHFLNKLYHINECLRKIHDFYYKIVSKQEENIMDRAIKDLDAVLHTLILVQEAYRNGILDTIELDKLLNGPIEALIDYIDL